MAEAADLDPGTVLDVGCGEGGDATWLASQGWTGTAVDPSRVALDRAHTVAAVAGVAVTWVHAGLLEMPGGPAATTWFPPSTRRCATPTTTRPWPHWSGRSRPLGPCWWCTISSSATTTTTTSTTSPSTSPTRTTTSMPADVAAFLDRVEHGSWEVEVSETRPRSGPLPPDARHVEDVGFRARRTG